MHDGLMGLDGMSRVEGIRACKRLNANQLKLLAIAAMILDHCTVVFVPEAFPARWLLRMQGRIAAPTMCFFIAEGYTHTSNLKKYMGRLLLAAVVSHVPYNLCFGYEIWNIFRATDVMFSLLLGLAALAIWKSEDIAPWKRLLGVVVCCILAYSADWNYIAVLWILGFGIFHGNPGRQLAAFTAVAVLYLLQGLIYETSFPFISRFGVFLILPLLFLYNGQRGRKSRLIKWGFYWIYPIHLLLIYAVDRLI